MIVEIIKPMPLISIKTSLSQIDNEQQLLSNISSQLSQLTRKPESYVMTLIQKNIPMFFGGTDEPSCFVEVKSIGGIEPKTMSKQICDTISANLNIPPSRIYINFEDVPASNWGFNSMTFG